MKTIVWLLAGGCLWLTACKNEQAPAPVLPVDTTFRCEKARVTTAYVFEALQVNCTSRKCHPGRGPVAADFSTPEKLKTYISNSRAVFEARVTGPQANMPPSRFPPLTKGMKDSIACWISKGMPDQ
ncbi:hypothetical protein [Chitinophaga nivalis]|uniref:Lipoprotein n=1 Tax=Chitinophaga nivalis TaxID=2991709 RepID=A0ABT3ITY4_9BACT|nr:hypothetical protein [Chitinophaga nivalis]MCW3462872.1 hypothetical protein [Chitinophaga nivalis]MCW3487438.1 hypothetical protein [Chitinophaga nivalis]